MSERTYPSLKADDVESEHTTLRVQLDVGDVVFGASRIGGDGVVAHFPRYENWPGVGGFVPDEELPNLRKIFLRVLTSIENEMEDRNMLGRVTKRDG